MATGTPPSKNSFAVWSVLELSENEIAVVSSRGVEMMHLSENQAGGGGAGAQWGPKFIFI